LFFLFLKGNAEADHRLGISVEVCVDGKNYAGFENAMETCAAEVLFPVKPIVVFTGSTVALP
jgi:hypothetical protein